MRFHRVAYADNDLPLNCPRRELAAQLHAACAVKRYDRNPRH